MTNILLAPPTESTTSTEAESGATKRGAAIERLRPGRRRTGLLFALALGVAAVLPIAEGLTAPNSSDSPVTLSTGSMYNVVDQVGARGLWAQGITGAGVNVAIIDTGIAPVEALSGAGKVVAAIDLSAEQNDPALQFVDNNGHGTHMAGIIAGNTSDGDPTSAVNEPDRLMGVAPDAGLVSVKVAGRDGEVTSSSLIAGIDWVVENSNDLEVGVLTLAFNSPEQQSYRVDALAAAVERAWAAGIVVVVAAGNDGADSNGLSAPANDPFVIAVGGVEATESGFVVPEWASSGDGIRNPDLAAPGAHIQSLRAPGSAADIDHPEGFVDEQLFLASGSSPAAAVVAGGAALLLQARPELTPDEVKQLLVTTANGFLGDDAARTGAGVIDLAAAVEGELTDATQSWQHAVSLPVPPATGVMAVALDPTSSTWSSSTWSSSTWSSSTWSSSTWSSSTWSSSTWSSSTWSSSTWSSSTWSSSTWSSSTWSSSTWSSSTWSSSTWSSSTWSSSTWSSSTWSSSTWSSSTWS